VGELTYGLGLKTIDEVVLAKETTIRRAVAELVRREHLIAEGAGAAGVAALLDRTVGGGTVCVVLSGSNIDPDRLARLLTEG
jgi:threonine dehydratase